MDACHVFPQCVLVIISLTGGEIEASLMAQWVKSPSVMQETQVWSLSWEGYNPGGNSYPLQYSHLKNTMDRGAWATKHMCTCACVQAHTHTHTHAHTHKRTGWDWYCADLNLHWLLDEASYLLCGCHSLFGGRICSPVVEVEAPWSVFELQCEIGGTEALLLGRSHELLPRSCLPGYALHDIITCHPFCALRKNRAIGIALGYSSAVGALVTGSDFSPASTCVPIKTAAADTEPTPALGVWVISSDVPTPTPHPHPHQALCFQSCWCKSIEVINFNRNQLRFLPCRCV